MLSTIRIEPTCVGVRVSQAGTDSQLTTHLSVGHNSKKSNSSFVLIVFVTSLIEIL